MHYKRLQKYGKKLAVAILTSAVLLASGVAVHAEDTGEYMAQENIQETEGTESTVDEENSSYELDESPRKLRLRFRRKRWKHHIRDGIRVADKPTIWMKI